MHTEFRRMSGYGKNMNEKRLSDMSVGECGSILSVQTKGSMRRRLLDIGFSVGTEVCCVGKSPFGDPMAFFVRGTDVAIRRSDAKNIILKLNTKQ